MEQLRLEYLAREERFMLDGDRNELRTMKQELDELRYDCCTRDEPMPTGWQSCARCNASIRRDSVALLEPRSPQINRV